MNHGDTDDTEIVSGDEGNLTPIHDIAIEANDDLDNVPALEPSQDVNTLAEAVDTFAPISDQNVAVEPQLPVETNLDWQEPVVEEPTIHQDPAVGVFESEKVKPRPGGWQRVRNLLFGGSAHDEARLNNLTQSIEDAPESAVNYVLRGELYTGLREYALAQADFRRAIELAETQFELADWGLLDQVMRDRAITGLEKVQRRLR